MWAKLILGWTKHISTTDVLNRFHWLPLQQRIECKLLTITYKYIGGQVPQYLKDLITINKPKHDSMRSNNKGTTLAIKVKHETFTACSFKYSTPLL